MAKNQEPKEQPATPEPKKSSLLGTAAKIIAIIIVACIFAVAAFLFLQKPVISPSSSQFPNTNATVPNEFSGLLNSNNTNAATILSNASRNITNNTEFLYGGIAHVQAAGPIGAIASINANLNMSYYVSGNKRAAILNATNIPVAGSIEAEYIELQNGTFVCANFNVAAAKDGDASGIISGSRGFNCTETDEMDGIMLAPLARLNFSQLAYQGITFNYTTVYQSVYEGMPCTYVAGTMTQGTSSSGTFEACLSDSYGLPLAAWISFNSTKGEGTISITELTSTASPYPTAPQ